MTLNTTSDNENFVKKIVEATENEDAAKLISLLECVEEETSNFTLDKKLLRSTSLSKNLQEKLVHLSKTSGECSQKSLNSYCILRALLMVPIHYETPWICACEFVSNYCYALTPTTQFRKSWILTCLTEIQNFFQHVVHIFRSNKHQETGQSKLDSHFPLPAESSTHQTARLLVLRLTHILASPFVLTLDKTQSKNYEHNLWELGLELAPSVLSFGRNVDESLFKSLTDVLLRNRIGSTRILPWIRFVTRLEYLRAEVTEAITQVLLSPNDVLIDVPNEQLPGIACAILTFATSRQSNEDFGGDELHSWQRLLLRLLHSASKNYETYTKMENKLQSMLVSFQPSTFERWIASLESLHEVNFVPKWIHINMISTTLQSIHPISLPNVFDMQDEGPKKMNDSQDRAFVGNNLIMNLFLPAGASKDFQREFRENNLEESNENCFESVFDGVSYEAQGKFNTKNKFALSILCNIGAVLFDCIFLGQRSPPTSSDIVHVTDRGMFWIQMAFGILQERGRQMSCQESLFTVIALSVAYMDIPQSRTWLMRYMIHLLSSRLISSESKGHLSATICIIARSDSTFVDALDGIPQSEWIELLSPSRELTKKAFFQLADSLSVMTRLRKAILLGSMSYLELNFANFWWNPPYNSPIANNEDQLFRGLFGLCVLITGNWNECDQSLQAWKHLSEILVLNKPEIPLECRSWMYDHLRDLVKRQRISKAAIEHLLRATTVRWLVLFEGDSVLLHDEFLLERAFVVWSDQPHSVSGVCQVEDVVGLQRLVICLLLACSKYSVDKTLLFDDIQMIFRNVLEQGDACSISRKGQKESLVTLDTFELCYRLVLKMVLKVFVHILHIAEPRLSRKNIVPNTLLRLLHLPAAASALCAHEVQALRSLQTDLSDSARPSWLTLFSSDNTIASKSSNMATLDFAPMNQALCDFMIELLFWPIYSTRGSLSSSKKSIRDLFLILSALVQKKQFLVRSDSKVSDMGVLSVIGLDTVAQTATEFFVIASKAVIDALTNKWSLCEMDNLICAVMNYCEVIHKFTYPGEFFLNDLPSTSRLLESVWQMYMGLCTEKSSILLIEYIENSKEAHKSEARRANKSQSFLIQKLEDKSGVDHVVQLTRETVLNALAACFNLIWSESPISGPLDPLLASLPLSGYLKCLATDLHLGLEGRSGGIREEMYLIYIDMIECCAFLIRGQIESSCDLINLRSTSVALLEVAETLKTILCIFPLKGSVVFKKTFVLSVSMLPSIHRQIYRRCAFVCDEPTFPDEEQSSERNVAFERGTFVDSKEILFRLSGLRDPSSISWADIAGPDHILIASDSDENSIHLSDVQDAGSPKGIAPLQVHDDCTNNPFRDSGPSKALEMKSKETPYKLRMTSKETWSWSLSCLFLTIEENWAESSGLLTEQVQREPNRLVFNSSNKSRLYFASRCRQLEMGTRQVLSLLDTFDALKGRKNIGHAPLLDMLAVHLPSAPKRRMCALLCRISAVLERALTLLSKKLSVPDGKLGGQADLATIEALCCISAWLQIDSDFISGAQTWYFIERRKRKIVKTSSTGIVGEDAVLVMLPKVHSSLKYLQGGLRSLQRVLNQLQGKNISWIEEINKVFRSESGVRSSILDLVSQKLKQDKWQPKATLGFVDEINIQKSPERRKFRKKRKIPEGRMRNKVQKKKRRVQYLRKSRNHVINRFRMLDQASRGDKNEEDDDIVGNEDDSVDNDAYVDLEDFLVDYE